MLDLARVEQLGDYLGLFKPKGRKSGGSKKGGKKGSRVRKTTVKKSGGSKKGTKTIKAKKGGGQRANRRTQRKVSPSRSKKK